MGSAMLGLGVRLAVWGLLLLIGVNGPANAVAPTGVDQRTALWTYRASNGVTYEVQMDNAGLISTVSIAGPPSSFRLQSGIGLGSSYSAVLNRYGFPDKHAVRRQPAAVGHAGGAAAVNDRPGRETEIEYTERHQIAFTLQDNRVTRIVLRLGE